MSDQIVTQMQQQQQQQPQKPQSSAVELKKNVSFPDFTSSGGGLTRERSFVRSNPQHQHQQNNNNKRRSLAFGQQPTFAQMRGKPAMEVYRPPNVRMDISAAQNKLNVHAQEFSMNQNARAMGYFPQSNGPLLHSKSGGNMQQQIHELAARRHAVHMANLAAPSRTILVTHPMQMRQLGMEMTVPNAQMQQMPSSNGNVGNSVPRVKFALDSNQTQGNGSGNGQTPYVTPLKTNGVNNLQRSRSLSSADALARGIAGLGLGIGHDATDIGTFKPEIQTVIDQALIDPNQLNARSLMELANQIMQRAVEGRRYALPASRFCISIIAKEQNETYLEAMLNTCRQWYQERDKVLGPPQKIKNSSRPRFTAFMAFLTEMFCQLKRRQLQLRTKCDGVSPPMVLLTLLSKCCEDCVKPPVRSLSEIECLFFVLTCIGRDLETHLPQQLESLLSSVRDAFLNASASAPAIRRTLLQLIELQASHWQLPGNTVLYYYPSTK